MDYSEVKSKFNVCRACLSPENQCRLLSLLCADGVNAKMFFSLSGVNVLQEKSKQNVLLCVKCSVKLVEAFNFREQIRSNDRNYFEMLRKELEDLNDKASAAVDVTVIKRENEDQGNIVEVLIYGEPVKEESLDVVKIESSEESAAFDKISQPELSSEAELDSKLPFSSIATRKPNKSKLAKIEDIKKKTVRDKTIDCEFCRTSFRFKCQLKQHMNFKHRANSSQQCPHCSKALSSKSKLKHHIKVVHEKVKRFVCDRCSWCSYYKTHLRKHIIDYHLNQTNDPSNEQGTVRCHICSKSFTKKFNLDAHLELLHIEAKPLSCDLCGQSNFYRKDHLTDHIVRVHIQCVKDQHFCPVCAGCFATPFVLRKHLEEVHQEADKKIICEFCAQSFRFMSVLKQHMNFKHPTNSSQQCPQCKKVLSSKSKLKHHINSVHEKVKRFVCERCSWAFYHKQALTKHIRINHANEGTDSVFDSSRPFRCSFESCPKYFKTKVHLASHLKSHNDARPFVCWCEKTFKYQRDLDVHKMKDHKSSSSVFG